MKCPACGHKHPKSTKYCPYCGYLLQSTTKNKSHIFRYLMIPIVILLLIIGFLFRRNLVGSKDFSLLSNNQVNKCQNEALEKLAQSSSEDVRFYSQDGIIRYTSMNLHITDINVDDPVFITQEFLKQYADLFQVDDITNQFYQTEITSSSLGSYVHFKQIFKGIPVLGSEIIIEVNHQGNIISMHGSYTPNLNISTSSVISEYDAYILAVRENKLKNPTAEIPSELIIFDPKRFQDSNYDNPLLAWITTIKSDEGTNTYITDAQNGKTITIFSTMNNMIINDEFYDLKDNYYLDINDFENFVIHDYTDIKVSNALDNLQIVNDFYNSFPILSNLGLGRKEQHISIFLNAEASQEKRCTSDKTGGWMNYILGDMILCPNSSNSLDTFAHEYTHYLSYQIGTQSSYGNETAAVNESYSDIFAAFIAYFQNQSSSTYNDPWLISNGNDGSGPVRNINDGLSWLHQTWLNLFKNKIDPHEVSLLHSHAIYNIEEKIGFNKTTKIFYHTLMNGFLLPDSFLLDARISAFQACNDLTNRGLFGITNNDCAVILDAFDEVGIKDKTTSVQKKFKIDNENDTNKNNEESKEQLKVAYVDFDGNLWAMNEDGTSKKQITYYDNPTSQDITEITDFSVSNIQWSPDGEYLLFTRHEMKINQNGTNFNFWKLMLYELSSGNLIELSDEYLSGYTWMPDSKHILFGRDFIWADQITPTKRFEEPIYGLWIMNVETKEKYEYLGAFNNFPLVSPIISSDGNYIGFYDVQDPSGYAGRFIYDIRKDQIYKRNDIYSVINFSPVESIIVFSDVSCFILPNTSIYLTDISGDYKEALIPADEDYFTLSPIFSLDGSKIAFLRGKCGDPINCTGDDYLLHEYIYIYSLEDKSYYQLTSNYEEYSSMEWSPDGKKLLYVPYENVPYGETANTCTKEIDIETGEISDYFNCYYPIFQP